MNTKTKTKNKRSAIKSACSVLKKWMVLSPFLAFVLATVAAEMVQAGQGRTGN